MQYIFLKKLKNKDSQLKDGQGYEQTFFQRHTST